MAPNTMVFNPFASYNLLSLCVSVAVDRLASTISKHLTGVKMTTRQFAEQFVLVFAYRLGQCPNALGDVLRVIFDWELEEREREREREN